MNQDNKQEHEKEHHRAYMQAVNAIAAGAEKILRVCGDNDDGGVIPSNEDGPYVKLSVTMFALRMATNLYWDTMPRLDLDDDDDDIDIDSDDDDNNEEEYEDYSIMTCVGDVVACDRGETVFVDRSGSSGAIDVTNKISASEPVLDAIIKNMPFSEKMKLIDKLRSSCDVQKAE